MVHWVPCVEVKTSVCFRSLECLDLSSSSSPSLFSKVCFIVLPDKKVFLLSINFIMSMSNKLECRKVRKPKIEKLRRARINSSLESLKEILLRNTVSIPQGSRPTKLEKADILEMTVRYVEMLHEKLSIGSGKSSIKSMETFGPIRWNPSHEGPFINITNQREKKQKQTPTSTDSKTWFTNHLNSQRKSLSSVFDKENLAVEMRHENQSELDEHHWRPW